MFDWILNFLTALWKAAVKIVQSVWDFCKSGWSWIVATIVGFVSITHYVSTAVYELFQNIVNAAGAMGVRNGALPVGSGGNLMDTANTFFPVQEFFTLTSAYVLLVAAAYTYRLIKSWIWGLS
jgi:hypothetical protein